MADLCHLYTNSCLLIRQESLFKQVNLSWIRCLFRAHTMHFFGSLNSVNKIYCNKTKLSEHTEYTQLLRNAAGEFSLQDAWWIMKQEGGTKQDYKENTHISPQFLSMSRAAIYLSSSALPKRYWYLAWPLQWSFNACWLAAQFDGHTHL